MIKARTVQLGIGTDLLAGKHSINATMGNELIVTDRGVVACSYKSGRMVLIPDANIRGIELAPGTDLSLPPFNVEGFEVPKIKAADVKASIGHVPTPNVAGPKRSKALL